MIVNKLWGEGLVSIAIAAVWNRVVSGWKVAL